MNAGVARLTLVPSPARERGGAGDLAAPARAERRGPGGSALEAAEVSQRGGMWIGCLPGLLQDCHALGRGVAVLAERSNLVGIDRLGELRFCVADEAPAAHPPQTFGHA